MAKAKTRYVCQECGHETGGWLGRCPNCSAWNSLVEETVAPAPAGGRGSWTTTSAPDGVIRSLTDISADAGMRLSSGLSELDRVLGGGYVAGSLVLIGGDPGIGKSTLLLQSLAAVSAKERVLYVSGEESPQQIRMRADRLGLNSANVLLLSAIELTTIISALQKEKPRLAVIDSIQTLYTVELGSAPGSVAQVREVTAALLRAAKDLGTVVVLIGHVTKDGSLAGPRVLEHMVDTVLYFEGDRHQEYRLLRAVKNRFGATDELGVFEMTGQGLRGIANASQALLAGRPLDVPGSVVTATMEGTRPLLVEIQALLGPAAYAVPQRMAQGLDRNRLTMILAVLEKQLRLGLGNQDVFANVIGGLRLDEPAADLALAMAILSSQRNRAVRPGCLLFGELGLTGEIRSVSQADRRVTEASRLGFHQFIVPGSCRRQLEKLDLPRGTDILAVDRLSEADDLVFG